MISRVLDDTTLLSFEYGICYDQALDTVCTLLFEGLEGTSIVPLVIASFQFNSLG